jgi:transcription-repair coupling factor (superfamily II helicase)
MALNGIKEVSILAHPPSSRLPIETYISKFDDGVITEAGHKEFAR